MRAGHGFALVAVLDLVFGEFWAAPFDVAVLASGQTACTMAYFGSLLGYSVYVSEVLFA
jgi:hypothetical protein